LRPAGEGLAGSLAAELRARTSALHHRAERQLGLPDAIKTGDDYRRWLGNFLDFYRPLEARLTAFPDWEALGISLASRLHSASLEHDLAVLGCAARPGAGAPAELLPDLPTIAHALGALYVLEGATLGGQVILRAILSRPGLSIGGATRFFGGRGRDLGPMWNAFRERLDEFGRDHPSRRPDVAAGALRTFQSLLNWFASAGMNEPDHEH
jgi:heme oxygenase